MGMGRLAIGEHSAGEGGENVRGVAGRWPQPRALLQLGCKGWVLWMVRLEGSDVVGVFDLEGLGGKGMMWVGVGLVWWGWCGLCVWMDGEASCVSGDGGEEGFDV